VQGKSHLRGGIDTDSATYLTVDGGTSGYTYFSGNVGIGVTNPSYPLQVNGNINLGGGANRYIKFDTSSNWYYYLASSGNDFRLYDADSTDFLKTFYNSGGTSKYISLMSTLYTFTGGVGIGTSAPRGMLTIKNPDDTTNQLYLQEGGADSGWTLLTNSIGSLFFNTSSGGTDTRRVTFDTHGYVGIGITNPATDLDVQGIITSHTGVYAPAFIYTSDVSLKKNIKTIADPLAKISALRGVTFNWKSDNQPGVGLVAQEVEKVFPELVTTDTQGLKAVQYGNLVAPLVEAVKAQQKEIDNLQAQVKILQRKTK